MAVADSEINVKLKGDSKDLIGDFKKAEKGAKGFGGSMKGMALGLGAAAAGFIAVDTAVSFVGTSLNEFDRLGDATARLNRIIGDTETDKLEAVAENFTRLGLSKQDVLELSANFASIARAAGIAKPVIGAFADDVAATAAAMALVDDEGREPGAFVDLIGKAAAGAKKPLQELGITLTAAEVSARAMKDTGRKNAKNLTDQELASARLKIILEKLKPALDDATTGEQDLESKSAEAQAKIETLSAKIGEQLTPVILDFWEGLDLVITKIPEWSTAFGVGVDLVVDAGETLVGELEEDFAQILGFIQSVASPLATVADIINDIFGSDHRATFTVTESGTRAPRNAPGGGDRSTMDALNRERVRMGLAPLRHSQGTPG